MTNSHQNQANDHPKHIECFVAMPFNDDENFMYKTVLLPAIREALELDPYYWQVVRADEHYFEDIIQNNVGAWMKRVQAYIADVSDENPNVMMELGYMLWAKQPGQPLIVLRRTGTSRTISDLAGFIYAYYPAVSGGDHYAIQQIADTLRDDFAKHLGMQNLNGKKQAHYLSPLYLGKEFRLSQGVAEKLSKDFVTLESVEAATDDAFRYKATAAGLPPAFIGAVKTAIIEKLKELRGHP